jgi:pimeloyl-ACP methyl ester carboxylesterase
MLLLTDRPVNEWRREMPKMIETREGQVAYTDTGEGPVVVLLHATLHDRRDFDAIVSTLRRDHRVIALDWPGHGDSPAPTPTYLPTAASFADVLVDLVAALDVPAAAFVANSVGGFAAARLAITHPQRVSRLVLVNMGGFIGSPVTNLYCRILGTPAILKPILPRFIRSYMKATSDTDYAVQERALARAKTREGVALEAALWRSFATPDYDLRPHADRIAAPTLIIWGSKDTAIPLRFGRAAAAAIPGSRLEVLPTGHVPFSSDPAGFLALAAPFLAPAEPRQ